jgi:GAF domain-containing protein
MGLGRCGDIFTPKDVRFLTQIASQVAIAVDNALTIKELERAEDACQSVRPLQLDQAPMKLELVGRHR